MDLLSGCFGTIDLVASVSFVQQSIRHVYVAQDSILLWQWDFLEGGLEVLKANGATSATNIGE